MYQLAAGARASAAAPVRVPDANPTRGAIVEKYDSQHISKATHGCASAAAERGTERQRCTMMDVQRTYLPAAGHDWTLPLYDPLVKLLGGDRARGVLVEQADLRPGYRVLEVGCGTGTLLMAIARAQPAVELTGLDPDAKALARAKRKADAASVPVQLDRGFSDALPYPDAAFDRVFSCFMLHHLGDADEKVRTLREIRRVLTPGGRLHLLDFVQPASERGGVARWMHASHRLEDNTDTRVLSLMKEAGLTAPTTLRHAQMFCLLGLGYYRASAPTHKS
jgi:ubiquinone/menaquinone biosynthesis C-methylase UbiE